jgi:LPS export ABC transporter permease LptF
VKTLDRYLVRDVVLPFTISLVVLTFVLEIPPILRDAEMLISKGVAWSIVGRVLLTLLPQALGITIPMSVLLGILIAFGRLSADREFVALQACGVSVYRLIRPVALIAAVAAAADAHQMIVALPDANQTFREITFNVVTNRAESNVKPRVFFEEFPNRVIYVRDVVPNDGWRDVFLADSTHPDQTTVFLARKGRLIVNRDKRVVMLEMTDGTRHTVKTARPEEYEGATFGSLLLDLDADSVFPRTPPAKGVTEMSIAELRSSIAADRARGLPAHGQRLGIQQKFSIPAACIVLAFIGLALGVSNRKDGRLASFVLGFAVIFTYYVVLWTARAGAISGTFPAELAPWVPNVVFGVAAVVLVAWRARSADQPIRIAIPAFWRRSEERASEIPRPAAPPTRSDRVVLVVRIPHVRLPRPSLLDLYVARLYLRIFGLALVALLGVFYISTFMDLADKLFRGSATSAMLLRYFYFITPQYIYYVIPMSALVSTLVTIGLMTKNSELVVIKACGVSLYRVAVPLLLFALVASGVLFGLQEQVLASSNREADRLNRTIRGLPAQTFSALDRRWVVGQHGDIYHYDFFDPRSNRFLQFAAYRFDPSGWPLGSVTRAAEVRLVQQRDEAGRSTLAWNASNGWTRTFSARSSAAGSRQKNGLAPQGGGTAAFPHEETADVRGGVAVGPPRRGSPSRQKQAASAPKNVATYAPFAERLLPLEPPGYFKSDEPEADQMTYSQLQQYITQLRAGGYNVIPYMVSLQRKVAFPFVTLVMTLLAIPFAVTTGGRGALYGIGIGIVLAILYWTTLSVCAAIGAGGLLSPLLAAWAPNILGAAVAGYLLLTVRT